MNIFVPGHIPAMDDSHLEASIRLWPDPFEAPGVPPEAILVRLMNHPEEDQDLARQVLRIPEARRAMASLDLDQRIMGPLKGRASQLIPIAKSADSELGVAANPVFGEIWTVRFFAEVIDGEEIVPARTWKRLLALVVVEPQSFSNDTVCRAVLCGSTELCDAEILSSTPCFRLLDEKGEEFVAHLSLEYPVSCFQLERRVSGIAAEDLGPFQEALAAFHQDLPHPRLSKWRPLTTNGNIAYKRLLASADWMALTAETRLFARERQASGASRTRVFVTGWGERVASVLEENESDLALAASSGHIGTPFIFCTEPLEELAAKIEDRECRPSGVAFLNDFPTIDPDGRASGQWELPEEFALTGSVEFFLVERGSGRILGGGFAVGGRFLELQDADAEELEAAREEDFLLLICKEENL